MHPGDTKDLGRLPGAGQRAEIICSASHLHMGVAGVQDGKATVPPPMLEEGGIILQRKGGWWNKLFGDPKDLGGPLERGNG